jgi:TIR domain
VRYSAQNADLASAQNMADVFISYARADREIASRLADEYKANGVSVWYDAGVSAGDNFRSEILKQLTTARKVVVIWTQNSIGSPWVLSEAQRALDSEKLVPVRASSLPISSIPPPFDTVHTTELAFATRSIKKHLRASRIRTIFRALRRIGVATAVILVSGAGGWYLNRPQLIPLQSGQLYSFLDKLEDPQITYFHARGSWKGLNMGTEATAVDVECDVAEHYCRIAESYVFELVGAHVLQLDKTSLKIVSFTATTLSAEAEFECGRKTLSIDRIGKAVTLMRTKTSKSDLCMGLDERPFVLTLVDGPKNSTR